MEIRDIVSATESWLRRPLCRRYAAVVFSTVSKLAIKADLDRNRTIWWAFGTLINGDSEILGAWNSDGELAIPPTVFGDLYNRGVEFITYGIGDLKGVESAFTTTFPRAALLPSMEQAAASAIAAVKPTHRAAVSALLLAAVGDPKEHASTAALPGNSSVDCREMAPGLLQQCGDSVARFEPLLALREPYRQLVRSADQTAIEVHDRLMRTIHRHGPFVDASEAFDLVVAALLRAERRLDRDVNAARLARDAPGARPRHLVPVSRGAVGVPTSACRVLP